MVKNKHLAKSISDASWGEFARQLEYKAKWKGSIVVKVNRWFASSKLCSTKGCNYKHTELKLSDRMWTCPCCGAKHDRDINAAKNIEVQGLEESSLPVEVTTAVSKCRYTKIQVRPMKQEKLKLAKAYASAH